MEALNAFPDVGYFCPNGKAFYYTIWYRNTVVFAAGTGMRRIALRLPDMLGEQATKDGAATQCVVPGWYDFSPFRSGFTDWLLQAYSAADGQ